MLEVIKKRRSNRKYLDRPVEEEKVRAVLTSAMWAPTSRSTRAWEFVVVRDREMLAKLSEATHSSRFLKHAQLGIVVCYDNELGYRFREDCSICAEHIHLEATNQGLSSCWIQICDAGDPVGSAEPFVKELLGIPDKYRVQCIMPLAYAAGDLKEHTEDEFDPAKVHEERF